MVPPWSRADPTPRRRPDRPAGRRRGHRRARDRTVHDLIVQHLAEPESSGRLGAPRPHGQVRSTVTDRHGQPASARGQPICPRHGLLRAVDDDIGRRTLQPPLDNLGRPAVSRPHVSPGPAPSTPDTSARGAAVQGRERPRRVGPSPPRTPLRTGHARAEPSGQPSPERVGPGIKQ